MPIVYLAEHPALALLETLVHLELDLDEVPNDFSLLEVEYEHSEGVAPLAGNALLPHWRNDEAHTRAIGDEWLASSYSPLLRVPSALVPKAYNYLLNPRHPDARHAKIIEVTVHPYDARLL